MIIKSMSRKAPSFSQLMDYVESGRSDSRYTVHHNVLGRTPEQVKKEFEHNASFLHQRARGNYLYHEVISISRTDKVELKEQKEKLREIVSEYIQQRARNNMAYAALHDDKEDNLHFHVIISANEVGSKTRHRLSKYQFGRIKKSLENRVLEQYPELNQKRLINKTAEEKLSNKGAELKRRTGKTPQREAVREKVRQIFATAKTREQLIDAFEKAGLDFYMRGNTPGVVDRETGRKHRIKTLGFLEEFKTLDKKIHDQCRKPKSQKRKSQKNPFAPKYKSARKAPAVKQAIDEWIFGDFSNRDAKDKTSAYYEFGKDLREKNLKMSTQDHIDEWLYGDFSARDHIARVNRIKTFYSQLRKEKAQQQTKKQHATHEQQNNKYKHESVSRSRQKEMKSSREKSAKKSSQSQQSSSSSRRKS